MVTERGGGRGRGDLVQGVGLLVLADIIPPAVVRGTIAVVTHEAGAGHVLKVSAP